MIFIIHRAIRVQYSKIKDLVVSSSPTGSFHHIGVFCRSQAGIVHIEFGIVHTTEILIQNALDELCIGRTTLVVAHRLSTIKNADEIAQQLQTAITDYETDNGELCADSSDVKLKWSASGAADDSGSTAAPADFLTIVNDNITNSTKSKENGSFATATISKASGKYTITVTVGNESTTR